jgi:hypothetical protein
MAFARVNFGAVPKFRFSIATSFFLPFLGRMHALSAKFFAEEFGICLFSEHENLRGTRTGA